jgi:hypothetical protein
MESEAGKVFSGKWLNILKDSTNHFTCIISILQKRAAVATD